MVAVVWAVEPASAADPDPQNPTFAADIAPILQENCQTCHQPGGMAPMSLTSYEEVRPWASLIKLRVEQRRMPPWHIDKGVGIQEFKNDISLSDEEIAIISRWVDQGAALGDPADLPPPVDLEPTSVDEWNLEKILGRPPDVVIRSDPYTVAANGQDQWWEPQVVISGISGPRFIMANETRPSEDVGRKVTHHANSEISNYGIGKPFDIYPPETGRRIEPGDTVTLNIHYYPVGEAADNQLVEVGLWLYPEGEEPRFETEGDVSFSAIRPGQELVIPPHGTQITQGIHVLQTNARIHSVRAHQHLLGTGQSIEAVYPDGRVEVLSKLNWDHKWAITYLYEDHVMPLLPKGTVLIITAWYDNTANNPNNTDPSKWVVYGRRTIDEMAHMWIGITYLDDEQFTYLTEQREEQLARLGLAK